MEYKTSWTPYLSGYVTNWVPHDWIDPLQKPKLVKVFQHIGGELNWLTTNTPPDISVATMLLGQLNCDLSIGHLNSVEYVLQYLRSTVSHGIWFTQGDERLQENIGMPSSMKDEKLLTFIDSNWSAEDASSLRKDEIRTVDREEMKSIQGYYITQMEVHVLSWTLYRAIQQQITVFNITHWFLFFIHCTIEPQVRQQRSILSNTEPLSSP